MVVVVQQLSKPFGSCNFQSGSGHTSATSSFPTPPTRLSLRRRTRSICPPSRLRWRRWLLPWRRCQWTRTWTRPRQLSTPTINQWRPSVSQVAVRERIKNQRRIKTISPDPAQAAQTPTKLKSIAPSPTVLWTNCATATYVMETLLGIVWLPTPAPGPARPLQGNEGQEGLEKIK